MKNYVMNFSMFENAQHGDLYDDEETEDSPGFVRFLNIVMGYQNLLNQQ